ncbi:DNA polymerase beta superfamily protein [Rubinisphaera sp. JC750]|uniref:nucleotidyltransferase domain-containing protein n=1 Tax=Rubinisphaera sp. JC750 TaxID=2898658 RepID=UPI001F1CDB79|nr:nucleotidyltransferase domain-containing protein [Rubinisphaera sp. JC750]
MTNFPKQLSKHLEQHPYPLLFATISGAHLYGFPSADSDYDLRGVHLLPLQEVVGLKPCEETVEKSGIYDGLEIDLVTHDAKKFFGLLLKNNGYVMEQLFSPLIVHSTPEHAKLKKIANACVTKHHAHHYLGFAANQWKLFLKDEPHRVKPLLYVFRVLLTGIHLMRTGVIEANLTNLNEEFGLSFIADLVDLKTSGPEKGSLNAATTNFYESEYHRLRGELEIAFEQSQLPEKSAGFDELNKLLIDLRMN